MRPICWLAVASLLSVLPGCSSSSTPPWLQGDWIFDADASEKAALETANAQSRDGIFGQIYTGLLNAFSSTELTITDKEVMVTVSGYGSGSVQMYGDGKARTYEVVSSVPDQECLIKQSDGTLATYYKAGDEIYMYLDQGPKIKLFFKRKP